MLRTALWLAACTMLSAACGNGQALADDKKWQGPFGGFFSASISAVTDYSFAGISQTNRQPAIQPSFHYRTGSFTDQFDLWSMDAFATVRTASATPAPYGTGAYKPRCPYHS